MPTAAEAGYGASELPLSHVVLGDSAPAGLVASLPTVVYLYTDIDEDKVATFEERLFLDERVSVSSRFFNCVRISLDDIVSARVRKQYGGGKKPVLLVLDVGGEELKRFVGWKTTGSRLFSTMGAVLKSHRSRMSLARLLRKEGQFLKKIDEAYWKLEDAKFDLGELAKRKGKSAARQTAKLEAEIAKLEKAYRALVSEEEAFIRQADESVVAPD